LGNTSPSRWPPCRPDFVLSRYSTRASKVLDDMGIGREEDLQGMPELSSDFGRIDLLSEQQRG
jgi:hypothetical protein